MRRFLIATAVSLALFLNPFTLKAQFLGTGPHDDFHDTTILRPPAGSQVAVIVFEDLGCPACARAHPLEIQATQQTHVPLVRYDFPLVAHIWTFEGAVDARYIQHTLGAKLADDFRSDVFASQGVITSKDDIHQFTAAWLKKHGQKMPAPNGTLAKEVSADLDLGKRLNLQYTPTIVVVTRNAYQVVCGTQYGANDPTQILPIVKAALAKTTIAKAPIAKAPTAKAPTAKAH
jgi:protein-disulfide isomerase